MPLPMRIQPIDFCLQEELQVKPVAATSRFKRLFERQFLGSCATEKADVEEGSDEFEPSSVCLAKMVQNFIEDNEKKQSGAERCSRNRCNCFNENCSDSSDDEWDSDSKLSSSREALEILKSIIPCVSVSERNLLGDAARIIKKNKIFKLKDEFCRKVVMDGLLAAGYDASICKSVWEKSASYPAGYYEYICVIFEGERFIIDIDFRSEFEIARSTKAYKSILEVLPCIYVGKADRLQRIISIVSKAAKQSLKKKGMPVPPWRKAEYIKAKWLSPITRMHENHSSSESDPKADMRQRLARTIDFGLGCPERNMAEDADLGGSVFDLSANSEEDLKRTMIVKVGKPIDVKLRCSQIGINMVTGLASVIED